MTMDRSASAVEGDGAVSEEGKAAVIKAGAQWELLRVNDLKDGCRATPAIAGRKLYDSPGQKPIRQIGREIADQVIE